MSNTNIPPLRYDAHNYSCRLIHPHRHHPWRSHGVSGVHGLINPCTTCITVSSSSSSPSPSPQRWRTTQILCHCCNADGRSFKTDGPISLTRHPSERSLPRASLCAYFGGKRTATAEVVTTERSVSRRTVEDHTNPLPLSRRRRS